MILDGSGVRKNTLEVVIPPQPVVKFNPEFKQKIVELHAKVDDLPTLVPQFVDENSSKTEHQIERKVEKIENVDQKAADPKPISAPSKEQVSDKAKPAPVGGETWVLQIGSYKNQDKAMLQRDKVRKSNIAAVFIEKFNIDSQPIFRVRLGPFLNRDQSKIALNKIKAKYNIDGLIMKYNK